MNPIRTRASRRGLARMAAALFLAALVGPLAVAGEGEGTRPAAARGLGLASTNRPLSIAPADVHTGGSFYRSHLLPRLTGQFRSMAVHDPLAVQGADLAQYPLFEQLNKNARQRVESGTRKALEDFLLEATSLDSLLDRLGSKAQDSPLRARERAGGFKLGVGISHCAPSVELSQRFGSGRLRASLGLLGVVRLEYRQGSHSRTRIYAGYDAREGGFNLGGRFRF